MTGAPFPDRGRAPERSEADPARPGPGPIPDAAVAAIELAVGRRIGGQLPGDHRAASIGRGLELDRIRVYEPGDDVRTIDWNVTARTGRAHVREHVPERQLTTWLVVDRSASMHFGTAIRRKADVADGVARVVGRLATRRAGRLGVVAFGHGPETIQPPRAGRRGLGALALAEPGRSAEEGGGATVMAAALRIVARSRTPRGLVVVASDFRGRPDWQPAMAELAGRHEVVAVEIVDPREERLVDVGELHLVDPESGRRLRVDTADRRLRAAFETAAADERAGLRRTLGRLGVRHVRVATDRPWLDDLAAGLERSALGRGPRRGRRAAGVARSALGGGS